jgi:hypothetical protein
MLRGVRRRESSGSPSHLISMAYTTGAKKMAGTAHITATPSCRWVAAVRAPVDGPAGTDAAPDMPVT